MVTNSSNSCSIRLSLPRRHSGVVTKCMPLFRVHVKTVGWLGRGTFTPLMPRTEQNIISMKGCWK
jgi:hypothetical protein